MANYRRKRFRFYLQKLYDKLNILIRFFRAISIQFSERNGNCFVCCLWHNLVGEMHAKEFYKVISSILHILIGFYCIYYLYYILFSSMFPRISLHNSRE